MNIAHAVHFTFDLELPPAEAVGFVRDVRRSLAKADFIRDMQVFPAGEETRVRVVLPVNAAFFGQQELTFESVLSYAARGAVLKPVPITEPKLGWAEVAGRAEVTGLETPGRANGSRVVYDFDVTIHLNLPEPEKWGGAGAAEDDPFYGAAGARKYRRRFSESGAGRRRRDRGGGAGVECVYGLRPSRYLWNAARK